MNKRLILVLIVVVLLFMGCARSTPKMVFVEGGSFRMGSNKGDSLERPVHKVNLSDFYIGKYEVTQKQYKKIMGENPSSIKIKRGSNYPVNMVTFFDASLYCNKLSEKKGLIPCYSGEEANIRCNFEADGYRLPTEAEWEFAARGGSAGFGYQYSGSDTANDVAWSVDNSKKNLHKVGKLKGNELGIHDMSGNLWEFCWDSAMSYYGRKELTDPTGPSRRGFGHMYRGCSWDGASIYSRSTNRATSAHGHRGPSDGFRVVLRN